ncbi:GNAT family N-acetyltransferase [Pedobacter petrophilus]|uniref:GNAT family N-acetyltransferase n=1 Tax=Pedobacter petrophilus TaxID=1908241 RepID=A0A7K0FXU2_9SPHI|nr:GNAT family N-acetyltransferase [Pedobacter petrophilus]MRX76010.1 GNAT family N-acetyltransferase [Pedobacter petrophilus]
MQLPPYDKFPEIFAESIVLRKIESEDLEDIMEISFYDAQPALTIDDAAKMQARIDLDYLNGSSIHWGIADKQTNEIVGTVGYYRGFEKGIGELGCVLKSKFRGQGFMTAAMKLAIEYGINEIGLAKVIAITTKQNTKTINLLKRLGFVQTAECLNDEIEFVFNS